LHGLARAEFVGCADHDAHRACLGLEGVRPGPERVLAEILAEPCRPPALAAVERDRDLVDAVAAIPRNALHGDRLSRVQLGAVGQVGYQRIDHHFRDRRIGRRFLSDEAVDQSELAEREAVGRVHPEPAQRRRAYLDRGQVLHPVGASPAGHDQARREAVPVRQRRAVHLPRDHRAVVECAPDGQALHEVRGFIGHAGVGAVKGHLDRLLHDAGLGEHVLELDPLPPRVAHRAIAPSDPLHVRVGKPSSVTRTLVDRDDLRLGKFPAPELVHRELEWACGRVAADFKFPAPQVDLGDQRKVIAHEERVVRREHLIEVLQRRLVVGWAIAQLDERLLPGECIEHRARRHAGRDTGRDRRTGGRGKPRHDG
jgi:hypothetical protein